MSSRIRLFLHLAILGAFSDGYHWTMNRLISICHDWGVCCFTLLQPSRLPRTVHCLLLVCLFVARRFTVHCKLVRQHDNGSNRCRCCQHKLIVHSLHSSCSAYHNPSETGNCKLLGTLRDIAWQFCVGPVVRQSIVGWLWVIVRARGTP